MNEQQITIVYALDLKSPRILAYEILKWIYEQMSLQEKAVLMVQADGPKRHMYIKFRGDICMQGVLHSTKGQAEYRHTNREL